ncbi:uncharacterized protein LOC115711423 isoform X2 [Cannabis sativa]|uniref:uncharacterized protein LOC115711423 isoform X2 n=1 Tax=Cannabis sativa TaxID=3483 RepID=UPI0029C9C907|nr:uncharacterized protein LOC115711423 isoform X2 [Cannabis sativa]
MGDYLLETRKGISKQYVLLTKDNKPICRTRCSNPPFQLPCTWSLNEFVRRKKLSFLDELPQFVLSPAAENRRDKTEWGIFLRHIKDNNKVAVAKCDLCEFYVLPPSEVLDLGHVVVAYRMVKSHSIDHEIHVGRQDSVIKGEMHPSDDKFSPAFRDRSRLSKIETCGIPVPRVTKQNELLEKNYVRADPSYLKTLGQAHSGWIFGAIAELVDNARDANATKLDISVEMIYCKKSEKHIPLLSIIDDGHGMSHQDVMIMACFGHKQPEEDLRERIGRFGIGFKTGAMRLGRDALVLTQTADSRSLAFLSQSLNENKDNLEIPIVSYQRHGQVMEVDTNVQPEALAKYNLKTIKEFSPFNKYLIGEKAALFHERTGTQIYIWNLDEWGSNYSLEWCTGLNDKSTVCESDIYIRSRRIRCRPGQVSQQVPLDYSLRSYLEVLFFVPRMKIYVQGSLVKSRPLAKSLNKTRVESGIIMGKSVQLTLGRSQIEWDRANCGMFLYWHGRLIEAYKRVGGAIHNADMGRGVIGVIDVTDVVNDGKGRVWVLNNKQGFQDCEPYAILEKWLGQKADEYWDDNYDALQLSKNGILYKPDQEWVQCDKCRKWRMLDFEFDSNNLPPEWFCHMKPFERSCDVLEQKSSGLITVSAKRSGYEFGVSIKSEGDMKDSAPSTDGVSFFHLEGMRKGSQGTRKMARRIA